MTSKTASFLIGAATVLLVAVVALMAHRGHSQSASVTLDFTAPGDDGNVGTASTYQLRYSTTLPDTTGLSASGPGGTTALNAWWNAATVYASTPIPLVAGTKQTITVSPTPPFQTGVTYYFIMKACDEVPNCSAYSNLASKLIPDLTPPGRIVDLIAR